MSPDDKDIGWVQSRLPTIQCRKGKGKRRDGHVQVSESDLGELCLQRAGMSSDAGRWTPDAGRHQSLQRASAMAYEWTVRN